MSLSKTISFLSERPALNLLLVCFYYPMVVLPHEEVGKFCAWLFDGRMTRNDYNLTILLVSFVGLALYLTVILKNIWNKPDLRKLVLFYLAASVLFAVLCFKLLIVINIEVVHFVQYGTMALLLFPLVKRYGETAFWITLMGALDEAWQYFYLAPQRTNYYDFNDVIINLVGGSFGLILLRSLSLEMKPARSGSVFRSPVFFTTILLCALFFAAFQLGWLTMGPPAAGENTLWTLIRVQQIGFWTTVHPAVTFHVVQPMEGLVIVGLMLVFYAGLGRQISKPQVVIDK